MKRFFFIRFAVFMPALLLLVSCQNYYKATNITAQTTQAKLDSLQQAGKYFVLRTADTAMQMKAVSMPDDQATLQFTTDTLSQAHRLHLSNGHAGKMRYLKHEANDTGVLKEVHVYAPSVKALPGEQLMVPFSQVQKVELLSFDKKRTAKSKRKTALFLGLGAVTTFLIVVAASFGNMSYDFRWK